MPREVTTGLYAFDPTRSNSANIVTNEKHAVYVPERDDFHFLIPLAAPFFVASLVVRNDTTGEVYVEGNDYVIGHWFVEAMNSTGRPIAGSVRFLKRDVAGIISLNYHTLGGQWGYDNPAILKELSQRAVNPLTRAWAQIDVLPVLFPPTPHDQHVDTLVGFQDIADRMSSIVTAIEQSSEGAGIEHIFDTNNPHGTNKTQVGLGNVENFPMASLAEAVTTRSDRYMSPNATRTAIAQLGLAPLNTHIDDKTNPHNVTKTQVGLSNLENYPLANEVEARNATLSDRYMNAWGVGMALDEFYSVRLAPLFGDDPDNPTGVTKEAIGLGNVENYGVATTTEMVVGAEHGKYTTPLRVWEAIDYHALIPLGQHIADTNNPHHITPALIGTLTSDEITTLLSGRLATNGVAYDSERLFGMGQVALYADILSGQASNAAQLEGRSFTDLMDEVLTGKAADTVRFDGRTFSEARAEILSGTASDADMLDGKTYEQVLTDILSGQASDAAQLEGRSFTEARDEILTGTAANATLFDGRTFSEAQDEILTGTASDTVLFDGRSFSEAQDEILTGTASDTVLFDGRSSAQWTAEIEYIAANVSDIQNRFFDLSDASHIEYTKLFARVSNSSWLLTHETSTGGVAIYQMTIPHEGNVIDVSMLNDENQELTFVTTLDPDLSIWAQVNNGDTTINLIPIVGSVNSVMFGDVDNLQIEATPTGTESNSVQVEVNNAKLIAALSDVFETATTDLS